jgi:hypothetical protein
MFNRVSWRRRTRPASGSFRKISKTLSKPARSVESGFDGGGLAYKGALGATPPHPLKQSMTRPTLTERRALKAERWR